MPVWSCRPLLVCSTLLALAACGRSVPLTLPASDDGPTPPPPASFTAVPFVSAHRGGAAYAPENTLMAFRNAARLGVDDFEADMLVSADGIPVLMHDDTVDRTTNCSGTVADLTYAQLRECDAGYWWSPGQSTTSPSEDRSHPLRGLGVAIPTAESLFALAAEYQGDYAPTVTIEIKINPRDALGLQAAAALVPLIQSSGIAERIIVQSFNPAAIDSVKRLDGSIRTLFLTPTAAVAGLTYATLLGHEFVAPNIGSPDLTAGFVNAAHAAGKQVVPWTADRESELLTLIDIGVDGIITNYPGCLLALQGRLGARPLPPPEVGDAFVSPCRE